MLSTVDLSASSVMVENVIGAANAAVTAAAAEEEEELKKQPTVFAKKEVIKPVIGGGPKDK